jgi:hypothetical protein
VVFIAQSSDPMFTTRNALLSQHFPGLESSVVSPMGMMDPSDVLQQNLISLFSFTRTTC